VRRGKSCGGGDCGKGREEACEARSIAAFDLLLPYTRISLYIRACVCVCVHVSYKVVSRSVCVCVYLGTDRRRDDDDDDDGRATGGDPKNVVTRSRRTRTAECIAGGE